MITINIFAKWDWTRPKSLIDPASVGREAVQPEDVNDADRPLLQDSAQPPRFPRAKRHAVSAERARHNVIRLS